jgi:hypothetical protein
MDYQYSYLILGLIFLVIWIILFLWRKDTRKELLIISFIFGIAGLLVEPVYINDWWKPFTITNTSIGIEDFLFGFTIGGIAAVIYEIIFRKRIKIRKFFKFFKKDESRKNLNFLLIGLLFAGLFFGSFYILKLNTFYSSIIAFTISIAIIWIKRRDLIIDSLLTGILLTALSFLVYTLADFITPDWVRVFWYFKNVPNIIFLNVPIDDIIWYFLIGMFIGPLYEFWQEGRLRKIK